MVSKSEKKKIILKDKSAQQELFSFQINYVNLKMDRAEKDVELFCCKKSKQESRA